MVGGRIMDLPFWVSGARGPSEGRGFADREGTSVALGTGEGVCLEEGGICLALKDSGLGAAEVVAAALGGVSPAVIACLPSGQRCDPVS